MPIVLKKWGVQVDEAEELDIVIHTKKKSHEVQKSEVKKLGYEASIHQLFGQGFFTTLLVKCIQSRVPLTLFIGFLTAVHFMTNAFDGPIYILLAIVMLIALNGFTMALVINLIVLVFGFFYFALPFSTFFEPFVSGIGVNCAYPLVSSIAKSSAAAVKLGPFLFEQGNCQRSELYQMVILWGFFWAFGLILAGFIYGAKRFIQKHKNSLENKSDELRATHRLLAIDIFISLFFAFGTFLLIIPEFFYIKDIYPTHFRANTMFKMGYQAYMMMSLAVMYVLWRIAHISVIRKGLKKVLIGFSWGSIALVLVYMNFAAQSYYGKMDRPVKLDGIAWLKDQYRDTLEIVEYFNKKVEGQPVILEAQGDSYTEYDVVSAYTGLPTVAGWWVHQWLWRGNADIVGRRIPEIEAMYQSKDVDQTRKLLRKYMVEYVVISSLERKRYDVNDKKVDENKFKKLGEEIFRTSDGKGVIYKIR